MNDADNHTRFKPCLDLILSQHPKPVTFTNLHGFTPNSFCTLLRKAKHHHVKVLRQDFPEDVVFRFHHDTVTAGPKKPAAEPIEVTVDRSRTIIPRTISNHELRCLCTLLNTELLTQEFEIPGTFSIDPAEHPNVEHIQHKNFFILL